MPGIRDERFGFFDEFLRYSYAVGCMFLDIMLIGEFLSVVHEWWVLPTATGSLLLLVVCEVLLYRRIWRDIDVTISEVGLDRHIIVGRSQPANVDVVIRNDGIFPARDLRVEGFIDSRRVDTAHIDHIGRGEVKSVTLHWDAVPGRHTFGIRLRPAGRKERDEPGMHMEGEFLVRRGRPTDDPPPGRLTAPSAPGQGCQQAF